MRLNEINLVLIQPVFAIQLKIDFMDRFRPINIR